MTALALPATARAEWGPGGSAGGGRHGQELDTSAFAVRYEPESPPAGRPLVAVGGWTPPACWLAPVATPKQLKTEREATWGAESTGYEWEQKQREYYVNGHPHKDFELANSGEGLWWNGTPNPNRRADPASLSCLKEYDVWVPNGTAPPAGPAVTPEILAQSAYDRIRIPDTEVSLSPPAGNRQTVNVYTWAWLDRQTFRPVSVTARLDALGIWATVTATPVALHLDAGTPDADLYPRVGGLPGPRRRLDRHPAHPRRRQHPAPLRVGLPPCLGRHRHLPATITWKVSWTGSGGTGGALPDGAFDTTDDVVVQEIQAVNR